MTAELPGDLAGSYDLIRQLGCGTTSQVWLARQRALHRDVVLKLLRRTTPEMLARFLREARGLAGFSHPLVPQLLDFGVIAECAFLSSTYEHKHWVDGLKAVIAAR